MTNGVVAWCLELHDLWLAKAVEGRPKGFEFSRALSADGLVDQDTLKTCLNRVPQLGEPVAQPSRIDRASVTTAVATQGGSTTIATSRLFRRAASAPERCFPWKGRDSRFSSVSTQGLYNPSGLRVPCCDGIW